MPRQKSWRARDPHYEKEAARYPHPIPSRPFILTVFEEVDAPMHLDALVAELALDGKRERDALDARLRAMERAGQLIRNRRGEYCLVKRIPVVTGTVIAHRDGYGFVSPDEVGDDLYLAPRQMREVIHGDRVAVRIRGHDRRGRPEGSLVEVLERNTSEVAGRYVEEGGIGFVVPDNQRISHRIVIPPGGNAVESGQMVVAELVEQPTGHSEPIGRIAEVLGLPGAPGLETEIAIRSHGLPHKWPSPVDRETKAFGSRVPTAAKREREDLREVPLVTIDGADARDFDDAVYCESTASGWRLIVAIADVAHYVRPGTALDDEAQKRGTSVYFPNRVIPMLPEALSNGLCSLNPKVDRLCMACEMRIDRDGKVTRARFTEAVMRSAARLTYAEVWDMLDGGGAGRHPSLLPRLRELHALYRTLATARRRRGAIEFEVPQISMRFDSRGRIEAIDSYIRSDAHRLIEECMIAANVQAAHFLARHRIPTLFRRHDEPDEDRIDTLRTFLASLGLRLGGKGKLEPAHFSALLSKVGDRPDASLIETLVLRSMKLAVYRPESAGHFGLALPEYAHFTSPIRRYPDLLVHRGIKHVLAAGKSRGFAYSPGEMQHLGEHCSATERRADEATREALDWLKCEFMQDKLGEQFDGLVTGVTDFGLFVQLDGIQVDGLVHVSALGSDYFRHEPDHHRLVGRRTGESFQLGDRLRVRVARAGLDDRRVDFEIARPTDGQRPKRENRQ